MKFYDRKAEMEILKQNEKQAEQHAVFTVLMGRRRVGKTSLVIKALEGASLPIFLWRKIAKPCFAISFSKHSRNS